MRREWVNNDADDKVMNATGRIANLFSQSYEFKDFACAKQWRKSQREGREGGQQAFDAQDREGEGNGNDAE